MKDISVLILTHNAPKYVRETLETLNEVTRREDRERMEFIVWDNASEQETKELLIELKGKTYVDKLYFSDENLLFAGGNNACAKLAAPESKYFLLLNSDVRIVDKNWFKNLFQAKEKGNYTIAAYGCCDCPKRVDGYCLLIDRSAYEQNLLDEAYQWFWAVTKLEASILKAGHDILGFYNHDNMLIHYGGKSGTDWSKAKGMETELSEVISWFDHSEGGVIFKLSPGVNKITFYAGILYRRVLNKITRLLSSYQHRGG